MITPVGMPIGIPPIGLGKLGFNVCVSFHGSNFTVSSIGVMTGTGGG